MFSLCESMKWAHLPNAGGLYDQHPELLDGFRYIFSVRGEEQERQRKLEEQKMGKGRARNPGVAGRRRR
jgi:hypothetical protein